MIRGNFDFQGDEIYMSYLGREEIRKLRAAGAPHVDVTDDQRAKRYSEKGDSDAG